MARCATFIVNSPEDVNLTLKEPAVMRYDNIPADYDVKELKLRRGTTVKFLGLNSDNVWIETEEGERGFVYGEAFDREWLVYERFERKDSLPFGEPITLKERDKYGKAKYLRPNGTEVDVVEHIDAVPQSLWEYRRYEANRGNNEYVRERSFARFINGKTIEQIDSSYGKALQVRHQGDRSYAVYGLEVFSRKTGSRFQPVVIFEDGRATQYALNRAETYKRNRWLLKFLPFSGMIIQAGSMFVSEPRFDSIDASDGNSAVGGKYQIDGVWRFVLLPVTLLVALWMLVGWVGFYLFVPTIAFWIVFFLLGKPRPLKDVSERKMKNIALFVAIPLSYIWFVLMIATEQSVWWLVAPGIVWAVLFAYKRLDRRYASDTQCDGCKNINTLVFDHTEHQDGGLEQGTVSSYDSTKSRYKGLMETGTEITTYQDGHTKTRTIYKSVYEYNNKYNDYDVTYRVHYYTHYYKCSICGHIHTEHSSRREVVNCKYTGTHIETSSRVQ